MPVTEMEMSSIWLPWSSQWIPGLSPWQHFYFCFCVSHSVPHPFQLRFLPMSCLDIYVCCVMYTAVSSGHVCRKTYSYNIFLLLWSFSNCIFKFLFEHTLKFFIWMNRKLFQYIHVYCKFLCSLYKMVEIVHIYKYFESLMATFMQSAVCPSTV